MSVDWKHLQRARLIYSRLGLEELLKEENLMQRYLYRHADDDLAKRLYSILSKEIEKRLL